MGSLTNQEKIKIISAQIDSINTGLSWLDLNPSENNSPQDKLSTQEQKNDLISQKNILLELINSLQ